MHSGIFYMKLWPMEYDLIMTFPSQISYPCWGTLCYGQKILLWAWSLWPRIKNLGWRKFWVILQGMLIHVLHFHYSPEVLRVFLFFDFQFGYRVLKWSFWIWCERFLLLSDLAVWWQYWVGALLTSWSCLQEPYALWIRQNWCQNSYHQSGKFMCYKMKISFSVDMHIPFSWNISK